MHARGLDLETDTSNIYGSPSEVSLKPGYEATSEVYVVDKLTFFKGLPGDEASSINGCLPHLLPHPSNLSKVLD